LNIFAQNTLKYYIEFAKVDSKLACLNSHRDFDYLALLQKGLANIFETAYTQDDYKNLLELYLNYTITYFNELKKITKIVPSSKLSSTKKEIDLFKKNKEPEVALKVIDMLQIEIERQENSQYNATYKNGITGKIKIDKQKINAARDHYDKYFLIFERYEKLNKHISQVGEEYQKCMKSNITCISEFHQAMTHLSRYINSNNILELYRFDSHIIRAIFDTQKILIASLKEYADAINLKDKDRYLIQYINVKNIEVPGRNMTNFQEVYTRYNKVIDNYLEALRIVLKIS
jgi:hypothetical protein